MSEYVVVAITAAFIEHLWLHKAEYKKKSKKRDENKIKIKADEGGGKWTNEKKSRKKTGRKK